MTPDREQEIRETHPGGWYDGPWTQEYVEADGDSPAYNRVVHKESGTTLATLPDFAGGIALFIADAHDAVPELLAEVDRLRARVAELEAARTTAAADRDKQIIAWLEKKGREEGTSNKDSRVRATATYRLADKLSRGAVRPACPPVSPEDPHDSPLHHSYALGRDLPEVTP
ncbi:hypothetical protein AMK23_26130 [Streptomyces sp. CB02130]|nr:hypothetical protein AMK23_26130 [Streptomyces sp. CB02130]